MTYGALRLLIQKENVGADLELVDCYVQNRYTEILDQLPWKRQETEIILQAAASYQTGTLTATQGSNAVTGAGTTWTPAMTGLMFRVIGSQEYYAFTYVSATTGTLDRPYEGVTAALLPYRLDQNMFQLPAGARILRGLRSLHDFGWPMERKTPAELNQLAPHREVYGTSRYYVPTWDQFSDPPRLQVELYPVPTSPSSAGNTLSWSADYAFDAAAFSATSPITSASMLPWVRPAALMAAVRADFLRLAKDWTGAESMEERAKELVGAMLKINAAERGPQPIRTAPQYARRSRNSYNRDVPDDTGHWHEGYTG